MYCLLQAKHQAINSYTVSNPFNIKYYLPFTDQRIEALEIK